MSITKRGSSYEVYVYDTKTKAKRYVGSRRKLNDARALEAAAKVEVRPRLDVDWTVEQFARKFLDEHHGPNTGRPEPSTLRNNDHNLRAFRAEHGSRLLRSITRDQARAWATAHPGQAKSIAAMFGVAVDSEFLLVSPFARLGIGRSRGRADIDPLTEVEVERLAEIALRTLGVYGPEFWAFILWQGWTGMRPGETCALSVSMIDWQAGTVRVERNALNDGTYGPVKGKRRRTIPLAPEAIRAARTLNRRKGMLFRTPTGLPLRPNSLRHYWAQVRTGFTAEIPDTHWLRRRLMVDPGDQLVPYELRHHFGSMLADRGLSAHDIAAVMGNSARVCEEVYVHAHEARVHDRVRTALESRQPETVEILQDLRKEAG